MKTNLLGHSCLLRMGGDVLCKRLDKVCVVDERREEDDVRGVEERWEEEGVRRDGVYKGRQGV